MSDKLSPTPYETALISEAALAKDWLRLEKDAAWAHIQPLAELQPSA